MGANNVNQLDYTIARFKTILNSISALFSSNYSLDGSMFIRFEIWKKIIGEGLSSPLKFLFGSGELGVHSIKESFTIYDKSWGTRVYPVMTSESQYFDTFFRRGLVGLIFLIILLSRLVYLSFYLIKFDYRLNHLYRTFFIGFFGVGVTFIFLPLLRDRTFALFFFVTYAILSSRAYIIKNNLKSHNKIISCEV
tara:strand:- start:1950 stop:2531 length:582 start_codon:yes stop_codon:yes gene_type:complete